MTRGRTVPSNGYYMHATYSYALDPKHLIFTYTLSVRYTSTTQNVVVECFGVVMF
jgi:hypothetical protein